MKKGYEKLDVYQRAYKLYIGICKITKHYPIEERYVLVDQIKRSSLSIVLNIAEGYSKVEQSPKDFCRYLSIGIGSATELEVLIKISKDLKILNQETANKILEEIEIIGKMLYRLRETWQKR